MSDTTEDEQLAILFHDTYELLAPRFGYETREDTRQFDPQSKNGKLMIAVAHGINAYFAQMQLQAKKDLLAEVRDKMPRFKLNSIDELEPVDSVATVNFGNGYNRGISDTLAAIKEIEEGLTQDTKGGTDDTPRV